VTERGASLRVPALPTRRSKAPRSGLACLPIRAEQCSALRGRPLSGGGEIETRARNLNVTELLPLIKSQ